MYFFFLIHNAVGHLNYKSVNVTLICTGRAKIRTTHVIGIFSFWHGLEQKLQWLPGIPELQLFLPGSQKQLFNDNNAANPDTFQIKKLKNRQAVMVHITHLNIELKFGKV